MATGGFERYNGDPDRLGFGPDLIDDLWGSVKARRLFLSDREVNSRFRSLMVHLAAECGDMEELIYDPPKVDTVEFDENDTLIEIARFYALDKSGVADAMLYAITAARYEDE